MHTLREIHFPSSRAGPSLGGTEAFLHVPGEPGETDFSGDRHLEVGLKLGVLPSLGRCIMILRSFSQRLVRGVIEHQCNFRSNLGTVHQAGSHLEPSEPPWCVKRVQTCGVFDSSSLPRTPFFKLAESL